MEQRHSGEANRFPANEETPKILWNLKAQHHLYKYLPYVTIRSQINPVMFPLKLPEDPS